jgi:SAM-dependent methyltransferase
MKGFVPTPTKVVDLMVEKLFFAVQFRSDSRILDPGCGQGQFIEGVLRWCERANTPVPRIVGIDSDPAHAELARAKFTAIPQVEVRCADFLSIEASERFDFIVGNPPYVPITGLSETERREYRKRYRNAAGRFDLYLLFFEQALSQLTPQGRLVFITPEKFVYVDTARSLRRMLSDRGIEELHFLDEQTFGPLVTYPLISTVGAKPRVEVTRVIRRDGRESAVRLSADGRSWLGSLNGRTSNGSAVTLSSVCSRISCGVATGADSVFVVRDADLDEELRSFAYPTIAGRELRAAQEVRSEHRMLLPYSRSGSLIAESRLQGLGAFLSAPARRERLLQRTCVARKPWYAFHETPPLADLLRPKLLCKDIVQEPFFVIDRLGEIVPRHSVYYLVPTNPDGIDALAAYLNSEQAREWFHAHCQRAANGFIRLQSAVLKRMPIPDALAADLGYRRDPAFTLKRA